VDGPVAAESLAPFGGHITGKGRIIQGLATCEPRAAGCPAVNDSGFDSTRAPRASRHANRHALLPLNVPIIYVAFPKLPWYLHANLGLAMTTHMS
jgi:hypothetical protein